MASAQSAHNEPGPKVAAQVDAQEQPATNLHPPTIPQTAVETQEHGPGSVALSSPTEETAPVTKKLKTAEEVLPDEFNIDGFLDTLNYASNG
jgi:hypothetical protein